MKEPLCGKPTGATEATAYLGRGKEQFPPFWLTVDQSSALAVELIEGLLETPGVRFLGLGQGFKPVGDFVEAFFPGALGHAGVHVGIFVSFTGDGGAQILGGGADGLAGGRVACLLEKFKMTMSMAGLALGSGAEYGGHIVIAFHIRLLGEI